jgi:hypothetical protein
MSISPCIDPVVSMQKARSILGRSFFGASFGASLLAVAFVSLLLSEAGVSARTEAGHAVDSPMAAVRSIMLNARLLPIFKSPLTRWHIPTILPLVGNFGESKPELHLGLTLVISWTNA